MEIWPYRIIILKSQLEPDVIIQKIEDSIENVEFQFFRFGSFSKIFVKPFEGEINGLEFKIQRLVNYRNDMLPLIFGKVTQDSNLTTIHIKMKPKTGVCIVLNMLTLAGIVSTLLIFRKENIEIEDFFSLVFLLFFTIFYISFWNECNKAIEELEQIIDSKEI